MDAPKVDANAHDSTKVQRQRHLGSKDEDEEEDELESDQEEESFGIREGATGESSLASGSRSEDKEPHATSSRHLLSVQKLEAELGIRLTHDLPQTGDQFPTPFAFRCQVSYALNSQGRQCRVYSSPRETNRYSLVLACPSHFVRGPEVDHCKARTRLKAMDPTTGQGPWIVESAEWSHNHAARPRTVWKPPKNLPPRSSIQNDTGLLPPTSLPPTIIFHDPFPPPPPQLPAAEPVPPRALDDVPTQMPQLSRASPTPSTSTSTPESRITRKRATSYTSPDLISRLETELGITLSSQLPSVGDTFPSSVAFHTAYSFASSANGFSSLIFASPIALTKYKFGVGCKRSFRVGKADYYPCRTFAAPENLTTGEGRWVVISVVSEHNHPKEIGLPAWRPPKRTRVREPHKNGDESGTRGKGKVKKKRKVANGTTAPSVGGNEASDGEIDGYNERDLERSTVGSNASISGSVITSTTSSITGPRRRSMDDSLSDHPFDQRSPGSGASSSSSAFQHLPLPSHFSPHGRHASLPLFRAVSPNPISISSTPVPGSNPHLNPTSAAGTPFSSFSQLPAGPIPVPLFEEIIQSLSPMLVDYAPVLYRGGLNTSEGLNRFWLLPEVDLVEFLMRVHVEALAYGMGGEGEGLPVIQRRVLLTRVLRGRASDRNA